MISVLLLSFIGYVLALPSGSPVCRKNNQFTRHHGAQPDSYAPFEATAAAENDLDVKISITGTFAGLLLYVNKVNSTSNVGSFQAQKGYDYVSGCDPDNKSTLTHIDGNDKENTSFIWTAPEAGSYFVNAIVTGGRVPWNEFGIQVDVKATDNSKTVEQVVENQKVAKPLKVEVEPINEIREAEELLKPVTETPKKRKCRQKGSDQEYAQAINDYEATGYY